MGTKLRKLFPPSDRAALVESSLMGRSAVAVVVVVVLLPTAIGQLVGWSQGSKTLDELGVPHLATVWAIAMLFGAALMALSYAAPGPEDTRVFEIATNALIAMGAAVHMAAVLHEVGWSGSSWVSGMDVALIVNCSGRAFFLARQILWVASRTRADRR